MLEQVEHDRQRFLVGDLVGVVDRRALEVGGDAALADALGDRASPPTSARRSCSSCRAPRPSDRRARSATFGLRSLSAMRDAGQRAAGADGADEAVDLAVGLLPDLRARWCRCGPRGWRRCRTGWPRSRRSARSSRAPRPAGRRPSRSCWGSRRARPAPRSARRRAAAACPSSPGSASPGSRSRVR